MPDQKFVIELNGNVEPEEIMALREAVGWIPDSKEIWESCLRQTLCFVTARNVDKHELVGIGFLVGNLRHAQLVDMAVHPHAQRQGLGRCLQQERLNYAWEHNIRYVSLTWNEKTPWLKEFYESMGFREVHNAMWHERSLT